MEDKLLELSKASIEERIKGIKLGFYGMGEGKSTQLKYFLADLTSLSFHHVQYAIDSFDEAQGWSIDDPLTKEKWEDFYDFLHLNHKQKKSDQYYIEEFGYLLQQYLFKWVAKLKSCSKCNNPDWTAYFTSYLCHTEGCLNEMKWKED
ncbi:hypothetical protein LCGC14_0742370 [marine sediment metagenome]|uniref:Uncharacterized protein n=1 Tax=marine sediment metagenome TaxID=412755 RepID=A0A0F9QAJ5_9ZZZZ